MAQSTGQANARRYFRVPISGAVLYSQRAGVTAWANWVNVGHGGGALRVTERLAPGAKILIENVKRDSRPWQLLGVVTWSRPASNGAGFDAGIRFYLDCEDARDAIRHLVYDAFAQSVNVYDDDYRVANGIGPFDGVAIAGLPEWMAPAPSTGLGRDAVCCG